MEKILKVVLADRDSMYLQKLKNSLERKGNISVVGITGNGATAFEMMNHYQADVLFMDILLSDKDGFWLLENIKNFYHKDCITMIVSAIDRDSVVRQAIALGADYYMAKPVQGDLLAERIYQLMGIEVDKSSSKSELISNTNIPNSNFITDSAEIPLKNLNSSVVNRESEIAILLSRMGIPASIKGYYFIRTAILMGLQDPSILSGITKGLYPDIGKLYETTGNKVERAIRHAVESGWKKNAQQVYFEIVGCYYESKPANGQFIATLVEYFRMQDMQSA